MDAGGLAQMTYNQNFAPAGGLGAPGVGFGARHRPANVKRLSVAVQPKVGSISEDQVDQMATPRTSRSHLLAGLRTQPKTPSAPPASAPYQSETFGSRAAPSHDMNTYQGQHVPQTAAIGNGFSGLNMGQYAGMNGSANGMQNQYFKQPEVLAPPQLQYGSQEDMDPEQLASLMQTQLYLAKRQQQLQQQLSSLQQLSYPGQANFAAAAAAQLSNQFPGVNLATSFYQQQLQNGAAPITQEVPGQPGLHLVFNPMTQQYSYIMDHQKRSTNSPVQDPVQRMSNSPAAQHPAPRFSVSPPSTSRSGTPPKSTTPPQAVEPLPPASAGAFRAGGMHKKNTPSFATINTSVATPTADQPFRSARERNPATPMTGTFGPGQGRAGEHPTRQPRNPPNFEELKAAPTAKHEGSKNFATRQRRRALNFLNKAGLERNRNGRGSLGGSSNGSGTGLSGLNSTSGFDAETPASEISEPLFGGSEPDDEAPRSRRSSGGVIGGELKERSREQLPFTRKISGTIF